jgi:threonine aldolase
MIAAVKPERDYHPRSRLVALENTHNRAGGRVFPEPDVRAIAEAARRLQLSLHLDGARIWNAAIASGQAPRALAEPFDTVSVCFSKGLGAPVGSALVGGRDAIRSARRFRKMLGGGMRQAGVLAAGALYALRHHRQDVELDHANAQLLGRGLQALSGIEIEGSIETNIVVARTTPGSAEDLSRRLTEAGVLAAAISSSSLRFVTHRDVTRGDVEEALGRIETLLGRKA